MSHTLVFLHDGPGFRDYLKPFFTALENRFTCIFYDQLRGPSVGIDELLQQLNTIVEEQKSKVVLIGHSWGGILATEYALKHQAHVAGVVLISTGLKTSHWRDDFYAERSRLNLENAKPEQIYLTEAEQSVGKELLDKTWEEFSSETFESINSTYIKDYDLTVSLNQIRVPMLNIFGSKDVRFPLGVTTSFRNHNSLIRDFKIEEAGHFPFLLEKNQKRILELICQTFLKI